MTSPLNAVYEKFKHLDSCLSDPEWCTSGEGAAIYAIAGELWRAVKEERLRQNPDDLVWMTPEEEERRIRADEKAAENKRVLDELATMYENVPDRFLDGTYRLHSEWRDKIESLRAQPEPKGREPE